ncbi:MAG: serine/threonine-protein kinase [Rubritalea sp.]|uniref:serine/threonine-protein kinase n=1 Tax=Rubritalea sp. TaxID=2109375 RepID=UPI003241F982
MLAWALTEKLDGVGTTADPDLPGFDVLGVLGRGGMGTVYKAMHHGLGRVVALKVFSARGIDQDLFIERLKREGRLMAQLEHPNVLGIHDGDVLTDGTPYLVLEYVNGEDLQKRIYECNRLTLKEAIRIAVKVCNGLSAVHSLGVIHRDIKPANVLLGIDGSVKVTDFGVSKETSADNNTALTMTGTAIGTVDYMSPEQSNGGDVDARADIYSVGVLLYEMVAGVTPRGAFEPLGKYGAPKDLEKLVMRCLQRDPEKRPASASNVALQLKKIYKQLRGRKVRDASSGIYSGLAGVMCLGILAMFVAREMRDKNEDETLTSSPILATAPLSVGREVGVWVDLTKGLDVRDATRSGQWWNADGTLISNDKPGTLIQLNTQPTGSYSVEYAFTRVSGDGDIVLMVPSSVGLLSVSLGQNSVQIPELGGGNRGVAERRIHNLQLGACYRVVIDVTDSEIIASVDGHMWAVWNLGVIEEQIQRKWRRTEEGKIALGVDGAQVLFSQLRIKLK